MSERRAAPKRAMTPASEGYVNMFHLAAAFDSPAVAVLVGNASTFGTAWFAPSRDHLGARGLRVAGFIPCAALQDGRSAIPAPRRTEPRTLKFTGSCRSRRRPGPPPSAEIVTFEMRPFPEYAMPEISCRGRVRSTSGQATGG